MTYSYLSIPNIPYVYGNLLPGGALNLSGQTHVFTIDPDEYLFNPVMTLNPYAECLMTQIGVGSFGYPPQVQIPSQETIDALVNQIMDPLHNQQANQNIQICESSIESTKQKLESKLEDESLSEDDKAKVQELLDKLDELKEELNKLKENTDQISPKEAEAKSKEIKDQINEINNKINKIGVETAEEEEETDEVEETDDDAEEIVEDDDEEIVEDEEDIEPQGARALTKSQKKARNLADTFHDAVVYFWATDDKNFNNVCDNLTEDNIIDVMDQYKKTYGTSFMEDFVWDADYSQKRKYGKQIARILRYKRNF